MPLAHLGAQLPDGGKMNYEESRVYLDEISRYGSVLGLDNMKELLDRLGNPQKDLKFIHISGTNGKGSVLAYLSTILSGAGYKTGRYISPTLDTYREKIQVDGEYIEKDSLAKHVTRIAEATEDMKKCNAGIPTQFEVETVLAFLYFKEKKCDIVVLETGLGGTLDATNIIDTSILEIIMPVSMDHQSFLGDTIEEIAKQKAGIIKENTRVVSAWQQPEAFSVINEVCEEKNCSLTFAEPDELIIKERTLDKQVFDYKQWKDVSISLAGSYQPSNAIVALDAVSVLRQQGFELSDNQVLEGLRKTVWKGRFTCISKKPITVMDGAHNPAGARELMRSLDLYFKDKKLVYIFGVFSDKAYEEMIDITAPRAEHIITVETKDNPRALSAALLRDAVSKVNPSCEASASLEDAMSKALAMARQDNDRVIVIFGSLSFLAEAEQAFYNQESR